MACYKHISMLFFYFQSGPDEEEKTKDDSFVEDASDVDTRALALRTLEGEIQFMRIFQGFFSTCMCTEMDLLRGAGDDVRTRSY